MDFTAILRKWWRRDSRRQVRHPRYVRPALEGLEAREVPAVFTWAAAANGDWNVPGNWAPGGVALPGPADTVRFNATSVTNANMNLGGVGFHHIAKLEITAGYTGTITLNTADLYADQVEIAGGVIDGSKFLVVWQKVAGYAVGIAATNFAASTISAGQIKVPLSAQGEAAHRVNLTLSAPGSKPIIHGNMTTDEWTAMEWRDGDVEFLAGKTLYVKGTFLADSTGEMSGTGKWTFIVDGASGALSTGKGKITNTDPTIKNGAKSFKIASLIPGGTDVFVVQLGTLTIEDAGSELVVQSGILSLDEDLVLTDGAITIDAGQSLVVAGDFDQADGTVTVASGATMEVSGAITVAGGTFGIAGGAVEAGSGLQIDSGALLSGYGSIVGDLLNDGTIDVGGSGYVGTLSITGDYTNSSSGVVNMEASATAVNDAIHVSGHASITGTLNFALLGGYSPASTPYFDLLTFGTISGGFGTLNLPALDPGLYWNPSIASGVAKLTVVP